MSPQTIGGHGFQHFMDEELPDSKIPWWDNEYEGAYSDDPEDGYPYDMGSKVQQ